MKDHFGGRLDPRLPAEASFGRPGGGTVLVGPLGCIYRSQAPPGSEGRRRHGFGVYVWSGGLAVQWQPLRVELDRVHAAEMVHGQAAGLSPGAADVVRAAGCVPDDRRQALPGAPPG